MTDCECGDQHERGATCPDGKLTARQQELMRELRSTERRGKWQTPMWLGGRDGSHHAGTLMQLVRRGLVETRKHHAIYCYFDTEHEGRRVTRCCCKGSRIYRLAGSGE